MNAEQLNKLDTTLSNTERTALATEEILAAIQGCGEGADIAVAISRHNTDPDAHQGFRTFSGGTPGLVPAAAAGEETKVLTGGGTWATVATSAEVEAAQGVADAALAKAEKANGGGAAVLSLTEDKVMTATDPRNLLVSADMPGRSIVLPDAATIEADGIVFRIQVQGDYDVTVKDAQGVPVGANSGKIAVGGTRMFLLMDKASGLWRWADWKGEGGSSDDGDSVVVSGMKYIFNSGDTSKVFAWYLSENRVIVKYSDKVSSKVKAAILSISGTSISILNTSILNHFYECTSYYRISDDKIIIVGRHFTETNTKNHGFAAIVSVTGDTIKVGEVVEFSNGKDIGSASIAKFNEDKFIISYSNAVTTADSLGYALAISVSGTTISIIGEKVNLGGGKMVDFVVSTQIDTDKVLVVYRAEDNLVYAAILKIYEDGKIIYVGEKVQLSSDCIYPFYIESISDTDFILFFHKTLPVVGEHKFYSSIISVSGESISNTMGTEILSADAGRLAKPTRISNNKFFIAYGHSSDLGLYLGYGVGVSIADKTISVGEPRIFNHAQTLSISTALTSDNNVLVAYVNTGAGSYGTAEVLTIR